MVANGGEGDFNEHSGRRAPVYDRTGQAPTPGGSGTKALTLRRVWAVCSAWRNSWKPRVRAGGSTGARLITTTSENKGWQRIPGGRSRDSH